MNTEDRIKEMLDFKGCDHQLPDPIIRQATTSAESLGYKFCPKCGIKL